MMDLRELVRLYGNTETYKELINHRSYERKRFTASAREYMDHEVIKWFKEQGWESKRKKPNRNGSRNNGYISRKGKHHTRISWELEDTRWGAPRGTAQLTKKTPNGGWATVEWNSCDLESLLAASASIIAPILVSKDTLPPPIKVGKVQNTVVNSDTKTASSLHSWVKVTAIGVVGLEKDGTLSKQEAFRPGEDPWFHMMVWNHDGAISQIITDGEILHPVKSRGKPRVTSNVPYMVDKTTEADKQLLKLAISTLFDK